MILIADNGVKFLTKHSYLLYIRNRLCFLGYVIALTCDKSFLQKRRVNRLYVHEQVFEKFDTALLNFVRTIKRAVPDRLIVFVSVDKGIASSVRNLARVMSFIPTENPAVKRLERRHRNQWARTEIVENLVDAVKRFVSKARTWIKLTDAETVRKVIGLALNEDVAVIRYVKIILDSKHIITIDKYRQNAEIDRIAVAPDSKIIRNVEKTSIEEALLYLDSYFKCSTLAKA